MAPWPRCFFVELLALALLPRAFGQLALENMSDNGVAFPLAADGVLVAAAASKLDLSRGIGGRGLIDVHNSQAANGTALWRLGSSPELVRAASEALRRLSGGGARDPPQDLALISSDVFCKPAGERRDFIGWHQDQSWWKVRPAGGLVNCWVAFDASTPETACVRYALGSHRAGSVLDHAAQVPGNQLYWSIDLPADDERSAVCAELQPGEFTVFSGLVVHSSPPNSGPKRRCGVVFRYTEWPAALDSYELNGEPYYPHPRRLRVPAGRDDL